MSSVGTQNFTGTHINRTEQQTNRPVEIQEKERAPSLLKGKLGPDTFSFLSCEIQRLRKHCHCEISILHETLHGFSMVHGAMKVLGNQEIDFIKMIP